MIKWGFDHKVDIVNELTSANALQRILYKLTRKNTGRFKEPDSIAINTRAGELKAETVDCEDFPGILIRLNGVIVTVVEYEGDSNRLISIAYKTALENDEEPVVTEIEL